MLYRSGEEAGVYQHWMISSLLTAKSHVFGISKIYYFFPKTIYKMEIMPIFGFSLECLNTLFHKVTLFVLYRQLCIEVRVTCRSCSPLPIPAEEYRDN